MNVSLEDRVVLVTGAASGIGQAVARAAAKAGSANLMLTDRDTAGLMKTANTTGASTYVADLSEPCAADRIVAETIRVFGSIDCLVNAAGLTDRGGITDSDVALWERLFAVNARAPFFLMQHAIAAMHAKGTKGSIVNILSMHAHCGAPELAVYAATKAALATLTKNTANACLPDHIRVNGLNVGWVATSNEHQMQSEVLGKGNDWATQAAANLPLGRLLSEQEVARHAVFQLSDASAPMTGVCTDLEQTVVGA